MLRINSHAGVCGLKTVTIEELKDRTNVTDSQLNTEIEERDMILLASYFKVKLETLSVQLGLGPAAQQDVKDTKLQYDNQTAVDEALRLWRKANPGAATYRALVEIVLRMGINGTAIAEEVCKIAASIDGKYIYSACVIIISPHSCVYSIITRT